MERLTEKFKDGRNILRKGITDIFHVGFGRFFEGEAVDKLAEYEDLEEQGKLLKLPVAAGDTVYTAGYGVGRALEWKIISCEIYEDEIVFLDDSETEWRSTDFGKTVFLTRTEAERALAEMEGK